MIRGLKILWDFSRPHTIIGSLVSICTLYLMSMDKQDMGKHLDWLLITLVAGISCNVFIVGLNQLIDKDLDKINKPYLPLASGALTDSRGKIIIITALIISLLTSWMLSPVLGLLITVINLIGYLYSAPPVQLKRHHLPAALAITVVRGLLVNTGMFLHFKYLQTGQISEITTPVWILTGFVVAFSVAIAWFKDLPDTAGDQQFKFRTLAVLYNTTVVFRTGSALLGAAYIAVIAWAVMANEWFLTFTHAIASLLFTGLILQTNSENHTSIVRFYKLFWVFFFAEYLFFGLWTII
jgi:homogentisate phytyltransferase/homogentisate geranylgeranyltransferase